MTTKVNFFDDIERLRGFACILILIQHIAWICPMRFIYNIVPTELLVGSGAIHIFFAISGFVVTLSLKDKVSTLQGNAFLERLLSAKTLLSSFYKKRFFRIFPVVLFVMLLLGMFLWLTEKNSAWITAFLRAPMEILFGVYNNSVELFVAKEKIHTMGCGPFWTLAIEAQFYILWPIILLLCKNNNIRAIVALSLGCAFLFIVQPVISAFYGTKYYMIYNNVSELFLGAFCAFLYSENISYEFNKKIAMLISVILVMTVWFYPNALNDKFFYSNIIVSISSVSVVALAAFFRGSFDIPLLGKFFEVLGRRSYSFYAVQLTLANIIVWFTNSVYFPKESFSEYEFYFYQLIMFMFVLLAISELVYRFIERPSRAFGRR